MSAVASTAEYVAQPTLELVERTDAQLADQEMYRWMMWFGLPSLVTALFMATVFATGSIWWISGAIAGVISSVGMLIWLSMTSDTNT